MQDKAKTPRCQFCQARLKSIFCDLNQKELSILDSSKHCNIYKRGEQILREGTCPYGIFCINSGKVKLTKLGEGGKEQIVAFAKPGDVIGYKAILSGEPYSASATALEETSVCFISKEVFFGMVEKNITLSLQLMKLLSNEVRTMRQQVIHMTQKSVRERMAEALLFLQQVYGFEKDNLTLNVTLSRKEIANIVGTATETAIRLLSEFNKDGIIELKRKKIKILKPRELVHIANLSE
jgi:CRP/FNR family transcriptional regulator